MLANGYVEAEEKVWQAMASIVERMTRNPRVKIGAELSLTHARLLALRARRLDEISSLKTQLARAPHDEAAQWLLEERNERLADLRDAELILTALFN